MFVFLLSQVGLPQSLGLVGTACGAYPAQNRAVVGWVSRFGWLGWAVLEKVVEYILALALVQEQVQCINTLDGSSAREVSSQG